MYKVFSVQNSGSLAIQSNAGKTLIIQHDSSFATRRECEILFKKNKSTHELDFWEPFTRITVSRFINFATMEYHLCGFILWTTAKNTIWIYGFMFTENILTDIDIKNYTINIFQNWINRNFEVCSWCRFLINNNKKKPKKNINIKKYCIIGLQEIKLQEHIKNFNSKLLKAED